MAASSINRLTVEAAIGNMEQVTGIIEEQLDAAGCPMKIIMKILVCVEEAYVNIANYAYGESKGLCTVEIETGSKDETSYVRIQLRDSGKPFNPLEQEDPDITLSADDREIGGLGIFMVKNIMDKVDYTYEVNENILTMEKTW